MKLETLINRYKNLGYTPQGLERNLEIASIIKWLYDTYDIFIGVQYMSMKFPPVNGIPVHKQFTAYHIWNTKEDWHNTFHGDNHFNKPYDAYYDGVRTIYKAIKFQYGSQSDYRKNKQLDANQNL
jgi:hypothetical protein